MLSEGETKAERDSGEKKARFVKGKKMVAPS
jgi:hypothetical protein